MNRLAVWYLAEITWSVLNWAFRFSLMLAVVSTAAADTILIVKTDGKHVVFDTATGETSPAPFDAVYVEQGIPRVPGPDDPDDPQPPRNDGFVDFVKEQADKIDDPSGAALFAEGVYGQFEKELKRGAVPIGANEINEALKEILDEAMDLYPNRRLKKEKEWEDFHGVMLAELSGRLIRNGGELTKQQYVDFFGEVRAGLEASNEGASLDVFIQPIIEALIKLVIRILQDLFANNQMELQELESALSEISLAEGIR